MGVVKPAMKRIALIIGTGFGSGYLKTAPGTWGSLVGFGYFALLLHAPLMLASAAVAGVIALSIWSSEVARGHWVGRIPARW